MFVTKRSTSSSMSLTDYESSNTTSSEDNQTNWMALATSRTPPLNTRRPKGKKSSRSWSPFKWVAKRVRGSFGTIFSSPSKTIDVIIFAFLLLCIPIQRASCQPSIDPSLMIPSMHRHEPSTLAPLLDIPSEGQDVMPQGGSLLSSKSEGFPSAALKQRMLRRRKRSTSTCVRHDASHDATMAHLGRWLTGGNETAPSPLFAPAAQPLRPFDPTEELRGFLDTMDATFDGLKPSKDLNHRKHHHHHHHHRNKRSASETEEAKSGRILLAGDRLCPEDESSSEGSSSNDSVDFEPGHNLMEHSLCPWYWEADYDPARIPALIPEAKCRCHRAPSKGSSASAIECHEAKIQIRVLRYDSTCGGFTPHLEEISIACVAAKTKGFVVTKHGGVEKEVHGGPGVTV